MIKIIFAFISLLMITSQNVDREKEIPGKYIGCGILFPGKHQLILKENGEFVKRGYSMLPKRDELEPLPPGLHRPSQESNTKKNKYKNKGSWVYFKKDTLDGVVLKTTKRTDSLYFQENGSLSITKPNSDLNVNRSVNLNDTNVHVIVSSYSRTTVIGIEYKKKKD